MKTAKDLTMESEKFFCIPNEIPKPLFPKEQPLVAEFCSGNGQWIVERAKKCPHLNWLAIEIKFERARKILGRAMRENVPNVCVICGDGALFAKQYAPLLSEVYINFPDPWPKRRHFKNRLIQYDFLQDLSKVVTPLGLCTCVTDDAPFALAVQKEFERSSFWEQVHSESTDYGASFFKELWESKGRKIYYLSFRRI